MKQHRSFWNENRAALFGVALLVVAASLRGLLSSNVDTPDSSMHLLDGYFFYDLFRDHPHAHLAQYALHYYKQYPALGFVFWPPLFSFVLGAFFLVTGPGMLSARLCLVCFGLVFGFSFYAILRRRFSPLLAFCAAAAAVTMPGLTRSLNQLLLELPAVAMMCLAVASYYFMVDRMTAQKSVVRPLLCGAACAAVIYTKQPGWFLYPALATDVLVLRRQLLRRREIWIAAAALTVLCLPLAAFTLTYGHANLAQSIGSNTRSIMSTYQAIPRASVAAWLFYPRLTASSLNPLVLVFALAALVLAVARRRFLTGNVLWFSWFVLAYLSLSFYDNRQARLATFWWPAWVALAAAALHAGLQHLPRGKAWMLPALLLVPIPAELWTTWHTDYAEFRGEGPAVAHLFAAGPPGNILLLGEYKQVSTALIRENDPDRVVQVIRGDKLLASGENLDSVCRRYKIGTVLIESPQTDATPLSHGESGNLKPLANDLFSKGGIVYRAISYRYTGPVEAIMAEVPLGDDAS